jgi:hypothetical protein
MEYTLELEARIIKARLSLFARGWRDRSSSDFAGWISPCGLDLLHTCGLRGDNASEQEVKRWFSVFFLF